MSWFKPKDKRSGTAGYSIDGYDEPFNDELPWWDADAEPAPKHSPARSSSAGIKRKTGLSGFWGDRFGGFRNWYNKGNDLSIYVQALSTVTRLGSIIYNDPNLVFMWGNGEDADGASRVHSGQIGIKLDKAPITKRPKAWSEEEGVDSLIGDALGACAAHKTRFDHYTYGVWLNGFVSEARDALKKLAAAATKRGEPFPYSHPDWPHISDNVVMTLRYLAGFEYVKKEFPGYIGYYERDREFRHRDEKRDELQVLAEEMLARNPDEIGAAAAIAIWNAVAPPAHRIELDPRFEEIADYMRTHASRAGADLQQLAKDVLHQLSKFTALTENSYAASEAMGEASAALPNGVPEEAMDDDEALEVEEASAADYIKAEARENCLLPDTRYGHTAEASVASRWERANSLGTYEHSLAQVRPLITRTRDALAFRNELEFMHEYGLRRGLIDENGLADVAFGSDRVFRVQDVIAQPSVHIGILLDESGSMAGRGDRVARECAILLHEACRELPGVAISIWGHTANEGMNEDGAIIFRYIERNEGDPVALGNVHGRSNNLDGYAIGYCGKRMLDDARPDESRVLFVLSDGRPAGSVNTHHYGGTAHTRNMIDKCRATGTEVFGLGIGTGMSMHDIQEMYGDKNGVSCPTAADMPGVLAELVTRVLRAGHV